MLLSFLAEVGTVHPHFTQFTILGELIVWGLIVIVHELTKEFLGDLERERMVGKEVIDEQGSTTEISIMQFSLHDSHHI